MKRQPTKLAETQYDLAIVGGGIYGVCAAWDAALRGLKTALIEKGDFGHATSANSLKTVHGGLRYLQHLDIKRMRESIYERMTLMKIAPHLVYPLPVIMPTYSYKLKSRPALFAALIINDIIGFDRNRLNDPDRYLPRGRIITKREVQKYIPGYDKYNMSGGALWYDCQCYSTERLTMSYVLSAHEAGADVANYLRCVGLSSNNNKIDGIVVRDELSGDSFDIKARVVLNAAGPWVDTILDGFKAKPLKKRFCFSSAMNIVVDRKILDQHAAGLSGPYSYKRQDGTFYKGFRILFFAPWKDVAVIGTNHLPYYGNPDSYEVEEWEILDFLGAVNQAYPGINVKRDEIRFIHCGLLPMTGTKASTGEVRLQREYGIYDHKTDEGIDNLITIVGVKYTTHRDVAKKAVDLVFRKLGKTAPQCKTDKLPVYGGGFEKIKQGLAEVTKESGLDENIARHLFHHYGSQYKDILAYGSIGQEFLQLVEGANEVIQAEVVHGVRKEMACKLSDIILRRTDLGASRCPNDTTLQAVARIMASELGWDEKTQKQEIEETKKIYR